MGNDNMFCSRNWDDDIKSFPSPIEFITKPLDDSVPPGYVSFSDSVFIDGMLVQMEDTDRILLSGKNGEQRTYQPYPYLWLHTIDEYIVWYCSLAGRYEAQQKSEEWHYFTFPSVLANTFENQSSEEITSRKNLNMPAIKKHIISIAETGKISDTATHKTEKLGAGGYLNYVFRELSVRKNATTVRGSIAFDGLKYSVVETNSDPDLPPSEVQEPIPSFTIVDYYMYELLTGISLSIEISAILLEMEQKLNNQDLLKEAFSVFCKEALPLIVQSKWVFTRNSVARLFFLQIYWDELARKYRWNGHGISDSNKKWRIHKALSHCSILKIQPSLSDYPDDKIQLSLKHLHDLIYEMKEPINFSQCVNTTSRRIAIFCNPKHEYVSKYIIELEHYSSGNKKSTLKPHERDIFKMVHTEVGKALKRLPV